jgi:phospholipase C
VYEQDDTYGCNMLEQFASFRNAPADSPLVKNGLTHGPEGQFEYDARNDKLPTVSWIICTSTASEHPQYTPAEGAAFVASKIDAIAANPDVWAKTAFILNYDENDGLFDHVVPPTPPPGTPGEFVTKTSPGGTVGNNRSIGAGYRVPAIIISPWTGLLTLSRYEAAHLPAPVFPGTDQTPPPQEPGHRPRVPRGR